MCREQTASAARQIANLIKKNKQQVLAIFLPALAAYLDIIDVIRLARHW